MFYLFEFALLLLIPASWHAFIFLINYIQFKYLKKKYSEYQNWLEYGNPDFLTAKMR